MIETRRHATDEAARPQPRGTAPDPARLRLRDLVLRAGGRLAALLPKKLRLRCLTALALPEGSGYWRRHPQRRRWLLARALALAGETADDVLYARIATALLEHGALAGAHRKRLLGTLNRLKRQGRDDLFGRGLDALIARALAEDGPAVLPLFEHALAAGRERPILDRFGVAREDRRWREGAALLATQNPTLERVVETTERLVAAADEEFLDSRVSEDDVERLVAYLRRRVEAGEPFAMLRIGDGEVYGFDPAFVDEAVLAADRAARETIWWDRTLDEPVRARLRQGFVAAATRADLIGFPSSFRLLRDLPGSLPVMHRPIGEWPRTARAHVVLFRELDRMLTSGELDLRGRAVCDDRCHQQLFTPARMRRILAGAGHVVAASCFSRGRLNGALGGEIIHDHILLPPHRKVRGLVEDGPMRDVAMPLVTDALLARIDATVRPGSVVLVAGGFAGKQLIGRAKERGGVVLDIGATADYWAGVRTRGELDFLAYG